MNITFYELRKRWIALLIWIAGVGLISITFYSVFETMSGDLMGDMLDQFDEAFLKAFGMHGDITSVLGYTAMIGTYLSLLGAVYASRLGIELLSVEERDMTADFLLSKPRRRVSILSGKLAAALALMTVFMAINALICYVGIESFRGDAVYDRSIFFQMMTGTWIMMLVFFSLAMVLSVILKKVTSPLALSMGLAFGFFILNTFDTLLSDSFLHYLIPYDYLAYDEIIETGALPMDGLMLSIALIVVCTVITYALYRRRDIPTAN